MRIFKRTQYDIRRKRGAFCTSFLAVFLVFICRFFCFGSKYYPQLNDYSNTTLTNNAVLFTILLGIAYSLAIATLLSLFEKLFCTSWMFAVIVSALPLAIEGTYILSNSIRIIPGLLLASAAANCFYYCLIGGHKRSFAACMALQFASVFFSPYAAFLVIALNVCTILAVMRTNKRAWLFVTMCAVLVIIADVYDFDTFFLASYNTNIDFVRPSFFKQIYLCFFEGGYYTIVYGFIRGLMAIIKEKAWLYLILAIVASICFGVFAVKCFTDRKQPLLSAFLSGVGIVLISIISVFLKGDFLTFANSIFGIIGFALIFDALIRAVTRSSSNVISIICTVVLCVFCICSVSEISDYRETYHKDEKIISEIMENTNLTSDVSKVAILNIEPCYVSEQNYHYGEHILGVTASSKTLSGAVDFYSDSDVIYIPVSLKSNEIYNDKSFEEKSISSADGIYLYNSGSGELEELFLHYLGDGEFELRFENSELFGKLVEKNHCGMFFEEN